MNLVFDFGAVLFDWRPAARVAARFAGLVRSDEQARDLAHAIFAHPDWHAFDCGLVELEQVVERTAVRLALARDQVHRLLAPIGEELQPIAGNVEQVHRLARLREQRADLRLFFLSNMPEPFARSIEERHDFLRLFDGGVFSGDVKLGKPDPAIYTLLADRHGLDAKRTWFVDDNRANVEAASALGWQALHLPAPEHLPPAIDAVLAHPDR